MLTLPVLVLQLVSQVSHLIFFSLRLIITVLCQLHKKVDWYNLDSKNNTEYLLTNYKLVRQS